MPVSSNDVGAVVRSGTRQKGQSPTVFPDSGRGGGGGNGGGLKNNKTIPITCKLVYTGLAVNLGTLEDRCAEDFFIYLFPSVCLSSSVVAVYPADNMLTK